MSLIPGQKHVTQSSKKIKSKEWFDNATEIPIADGEALAFVGSWPHGGKYPHWLVTGGGELPHPYKNDSEVEKSFREVCIAIKESGLNEVEKINRIHLLVAQLVNLPVSIIDGKKVHGGDYHHVQHPNYAKEVVKQHVDAQKSLSQGSLHDISEPGSYPFMKTDVNIAHRFADCRATNALFAYGLQLAGIQDIKWSYVKAATYKEGVATTDEDKKFSEDHAIVLWKKGDEIYVLDSYNIEFHGVKLEMFFKENGVAISSAFNEFEINYKKSHQHVETVRPKNIKCDLIDSYRLRDRSGAAFFPSFVEKHMRYPGLKCYHSALKTAGSESWNKIYSNVFEEQNTFPETRVIKTI